MKRPFTSLTTIACLLLSAAPALAATLKAGVFEPPRMAPDFTLRGSNGADFKLSQYRGKLVVLEFGYTSCPDVCPTSLATLAAARKQLGAQAADLQVIYVTVDPARDTAEQMRKYLAAFDPAIQGGTGSEAQLAQVRKDYGINAVRKPVAGSSSAYFMQHSSYLYLIDRAGRLRGMLPYGRSADDIVHDARILLQP